MENDSEFIVIKEGNSMVHRSNQANDYVLGSGVFSQKDPIGGNLAQSNLSDKMKYESTRHLAVQG